jgi:4,5-dihydroxyphthalate decarboxylase
MKLALRTALGRYPGTMALHNGTVSSPMFDFAFADIAPISRAFAPMVRELRYDVSEMAIATVLQAIAAGKAIRLLPVAVAARFQEAALLCRADSDLSPASLRGRRIGVRAYSQTTGMWLGGILSDSERLNPAELDWVTFEGAHVAEYTDPPWVSRAPEGADLLGMLREGAIDVAIVGNDVPNDPGLRTVFTDPAAAGARFLQRYGFMPVNHLVVMRAELANARPDLVDELIRVFASTGSTLPIGRQQLRPVFDLAQRFATEQGLLSRSLTEEDLWR